MKFLSKLRRNDSGATAIEYGLIASLIAVAIVVGAGAVGTGVNASFNYVAGKLVTADAATTTPAT